MDYIIYIIGGVSILLNIVFVWYIKAVVKNITLFELDFISLRKLIKDYYEHLDSVHMMDTYYGDETLQLLIKHTKQILEDIKDFERAFPFPDFEDLEEEQNIEKEE